MYDINAMTTPPIVTDYGTSQSGEDPSKDAVEDTEIQPLWQRRKTAVASKTKYISSKKKSTISNYRNATLDQVNPNYPRLIQRNLPFEQSKNFVEIQNRERDRKITFDSAFKYVLSHNWFHLMLRWPTFLSISFLVLLWFVLIIIFAYIYVFVDKNAPNAQCGLGNPGETIGFSAAFAFSLETCTTVGFGLPNGSNDFFEPECRAVQIAITLQMISSMLFNAFLTAFLWCSLARCEQRGTQVLFSNKAIIEQKDGKWLFHVRMYDLDSKLPIVETHVRLYCVSWVDYDNQARGYEQPQLIQTMRIINPDDDLGGVMFTSVPFNATHHIDFYSPLAPEHLKKDLNFMKDHGLILREADQMCGSNAACCCPVCGETYETFENLERHIAFNKVLEDADKNLPIEGTHRDTNIVKPKLTKRFELTKDDIMKNLIGKEILVVVEGIEPIVSGTFQALHSYKLEDIEFDSCFAPCVSKTNGKAAVDLDRFHEVIPTKYRSDSSVDISCGVSSVSASGRRTLFSFK